MGSKRTLWSFILHRDHILITNGAFILLGVLSLITFNISFLNPVAKALKAFSVTDLFFEIQSYGEPEESGVIAVVDISDVGDRGELASILERVALCDPACVGVDAIFEGLKSDPEGNAMLTEVVNAYKDNLVFTCKLTDYDSGAGCFTSSVHSFFTDSVSVSEGFANLKNNLDNLPVRNLSVKDKLGQEEVLSFPAAVVAKFSGHPLENRGDDWLINYRNTAFRVVSPDEIEDAAGFLEGKIVLLGGVREESDMPSSPLGKMPGVMIQAHSVDTLIVKRVSYLPTWLNWLLAFVLCWLFQITVESVMRATGSGRLVTSSFVKEAYLMPGITLFLCSAILCYLTYFMFTKWGFCVNLGIILIMFALILESRKLYRAAIVALSKRHSWRFLKSSIYSS